MTPIDHRLKAVAFVVGYLAIGWAARDLPWYEWTVLYCGACFTIFFADR